MLASQPFVGNSLNHPYDSDPIKYLNPKRQDVMRKTGMGRAKELRYGIDFRHE
jgi:hypothetical protein